MTFVGSPAIRVTRMTEEDDVVVAEGLVRAARREGAPLNAVFCDVFEMRVLPGPRIRTLGEAMAQVADQGDLLVESSVQDVSARGCSTSIAHPKSSRSPSQVGHPVRAVSRRPCASCCCRSVCTGSPGTAAAGGTSGSGRPSGRRNWRTPSGPRATW